MFYVETDNGMITSKTRYEGLNKTPDGYREISEEVFDLIGAIPCSFTEVDEEITWVDFIELPPKPPKPKTEVELLKEQQDATASAVDFLLMNLMV